MFQATRVAGATPAFSLKVAGAGGVIYPSCPQLSRSLPACRKRRRGGRRRQAECGSGAAVSQQVQNGQR
jgi:hypothetical protein